MESKCRYTAHRVLGDVEQILHASAGECIILRLGEDGRCRFRVSRMNWVRCGSNLVEVEGFTSYENYENIPARLWVNYDQCTVTLGLNARDMISLSQACLSHSLLVARINDFEQLRRQSVFINNDAT